jgi:Na+/Pi-cotransporter
LRNRFTAFLTGIGFTAILQSSTATALRATSFTRKGLVDRLHEAIKLYVVTKVMRHPLEENEGARAMEIMSAAINLEHIGDIIDKNLMELAQKKIKKQLAFSPEGAADLEAIRIAECRKRGDGKPSRPAARRPAGDPRKQLAPSRRAARSQAHPLAPLLVRLSGSRTYRGVAAHAAPRERGAGDCRYLAAERRDALKSLR